jgi:hypothetical protein
VCSVSLVCVQQSPRFSFSFFFFPGEILIGLNFKKRKRKENRSKSERNQRAIRSVFFCAGVGGITAGLVSRHHEPGRCAAPMFRQ